MSLRLYQPFETITSFRTFAILVLTALHFSCKQGNKLAESPEGYQFSAGYRYTLPSVLKEISGLSYVAKDSSVFAINDEKGFLYKIHFTNPLKIDRWKFGTGADYEDVVLLDSVFYVLKSKGLIEKLRFQSADSISVETFRMPVQGKNEFETLYYDGSLNRIVAVCKNCDQDNKEQLSFFRFNPGTDNFDTVITIATNRIIELAKEDKQRIKPSAAAIHPITKELFMIASVNKLLIVFAKDGSVKKVCHLDPALFKQPEGMTFTPKGDLLISNEAATSGSPDILIFKYNALNNRQ